MKKLKNIFQNKKSRGIIFAFLLLIIYYFSFAINIFWDTGHYMTYVEILERKAAFSTWDIVRGPIFPLLIYLSNLIFGKTTQGLILFSFLFYLGMLYTVKKIIDQLFSKEKNGSILYLIIFAYLILDPIIFGYYHTLLTEFIAMTISVVMCYCSWKWLEVEYENSKKNLLIYLAFFTIMSILAWHLKQPYVSIALFPVIIASILSVIEHKNMKNSLVRVGTSLICIFGVLLSIMAWNKFLSFNSINLNSERNVTASLGKQLMNALNNYNIVDKETEEIKFLDEVEKEKLLKENYDLINVYNLDKKLIDQKIIKLNDKKNISSFSAISFVMKEFFDHPLLVSESYFSNYLAIANFYPKITEDNVVYYVDKKLEINYCHENCSIAIGVSRSKSNIAYMTQEYYMKVKDYEQFNNAPILLKKVLQFLSPISQIIFKVLLVLLPFFTICATISFFMKKNLKRRKTLEIVLIFFWYSFLHILVHVITGAAIDRYASPVIIPTFLGSVLYIHLLIKSKKGKKELS